MLEIAISFGYPDLNNISIFAQIVDVPLGRPEVALQSGVQTSGTMGTAGVGIIPTLEFQPAQFADADSPCPGQFKDKYVDTFGQTKKYKGWIWITG